MNGWDIPIALALAGVLLAMAGYFGRRQWQTLRYLRSPAVAAADERRYLRGRAYRRLFCSLLMVLIAGLLVGWIFVRDQWHEVEMEISRSAERSEEQKDFLRFIITYWVVALIVLLVLVGLAGIDFWATARYGLRQHRRLQADQRELLQQEAAQRRRQRNGSL